MSKIFVINVAPEKPEPLPLPRMSFRDEEKPKPKPSFEGKGPVREPTTKGGIEPLELPTWKPDRRA